MDKVRSQATLIATSMLGVIALSAFVAGVFMLFGAWVIGRDIAVEGVLDDAGFAGSLLIGALSIGFGGVAAIAAHEEWLGRPRGRMLGLVVAGVTLLVAVVTLLVGRLHGNEALFYLLGGLAVVTALPLLIPDDRASTTT